MTEVRPSFFWAILVASLSTAVLACSASTDSPSTTADAAEEVAAEETGSDADVDPSDDGGSDTAAKPEWTSGEAGKSCSAACAALGKKCVVACTGHRNCGTHDGEDAPYAGYACYYYRKKTSTETVLLNQGRSLKSCGTLTTSAWDYFGMEYRLGIESDPLANPVSCCCQ